MLEDIIRNRDAPTAPLRPRRSSSSIGLSLVIGKISRAPAGFFTAGRGADPRTAQDHPERSLPPQSAHRVLKEILGKLRPEPARPAPLPPRRHYEPPSKGRYRRRG
jgi:hypothetical protein